MRDDFFVRKEGRNTTWPGIKQLAGLSSFFREQGVEILNKRGINKIIFNFQYSIFN
jgi:hypothetical protein